MSRRAAYRQDQLLPVLGACPQPYKVGYNLKSMADEALAATQAEADRGLVYRREQRVYECSCGKFHLTSADLIDGEEAAKEPLYIPLARSFLKDVTGLGAGTWASWRGGGTFLVDYEQRSNDELTFADRVRHARDRQLSDTSTATRVSVNQESLVFIGHYDDAIGSIEVLEDALDSLCEWLDVGDILDPSELITTDAARVQARGDANADLLWIGPPR